MQCGHRRDYHFDSWKRVPNKGCSLKKAWCDVLHLGRTAARQNGQHRLALGQAQAGAGGCAVRLQRNHARQRVAHVGGGNAVACQQLGLEREDAQHMVGCAADLLDALGAPGPDGRADEMHGLDARSAQIHFQAQVEVGRIDADEHVGLALQQARTQALADQDDVGQAAQQLKAVAVHGQLFAGPPGVKAALRHLGAANAAAGQARPQVLQAIEQQAREQIARGLARHHRDAGGVVWHGALSAGNAAR